MSGNVAFSQLDDRLDDRCAYCAPVIEAHHRVANHLAMISSYTRLTTQEQRRTGAEDVDAILRGLLAQLDAAASLHRVLARLPVGGETEAAAFLDAICGPLASLMSAKARIETAFELGPRLNADAACLIGQFVAEAVANAAKHMKSDGALGRIHIDSRRSASGGLAVSVRDDGAGPAGSGPEGLGARLLRSIAARLHARLEQTCDPSGYEVRLILPY